MKKSLTRGCPEIKPESDLNDIDTWTKIKQIKGWELCLVDEDKWAIIDELERKFAIKITVAKLNKLYDKFDKPEVKK